MAASGPGDDEVEEQEVVVDVVVAVVASVQHWVEVAAEDRLQLQIVYSTSLSHWSWVSVEASCCYCPCNEAACHSRPGILRMSIVPFVAEEPVGRSK